MPQSRERGQATPCGILLKKTFINETKLRHSWQRITCDNNFFEDLKNLHWKSIWTHDLYES